MGSLRHGIVICSRLASKRIPNKPIVEIRGKPIIRNLVERLNKKFYIIMATPIEDTRIKDVSRGACR